MDYLVRAIDKDGFVKISAVTTKNLVEKARITHNLSKTATAALGRTLSIGAIMGEWLKNEEDSITLNIKGDGEIGRIVVVGKNDGTVKGYVDNPSADLPARQSDGKIDVGGIVGKGTLTVVTDMGLKEPYVGKTNLVNGEIAEDFANYFYKSEQIPTVVSLGVLVDVDYTVKQAGGFVLQLMPGAGEEVISKIEENLKYLPSCTTMLNNGLNPKDIINKVLNGFELKFLEDKTLSYKCSCSKDKVESALISLGKNEIKDIIKEDKKAEVKCYFCNKVYNFSEEELKEMLNNM